MRFRDDVPYVGMDDVGPLYYPGDAHLLTVGPTGCGKGTTLIIPNVARLKRSMVVVDMKAEAAAIAGPALRAQGVRVVMINPFDVLANHDPALRGVSINVLNWLDPASENFVSDADAMAASMIVRAGKEAHWDDAAEDVLSWAIMHVRSTLPDGNLGDVRNLVCLPVPALLKVFEQGLQSSVPAIRNKASRILGAEAKERGSVLATLQTQTKFLDDTRIRRGLEGGDFIDIESLHRHDERTVIFLVLPPQYAVTNYRWMRLMVSCLFRGLVQSYEKVPAHERGSRVLFVLDEFAMLKRMEEIETAMSWGRGYGVQLWPIVQGLNQLQDLYGNGWETFVNCAGSMTAYAVQDETSLQYLSKKTGTAGVVVTSMSEDKQTGEWKPSVKGQGIPLLRPEEISVMGQRRVLLFFAGKRPARASVVPYWDRRLGFNGTLRQSPYYAGASRKAT